MSKPIVTAGFPEGFTRFWSVYPKKKAKMEALKAWFQTEEIRPPDDELVAAVEEQCQWDDWRKEGGQYIPLPATWLRGVRWEDEEVKLPEAVSRGPINTPPSWLQNLNVDGEDKT